ncbi:MAG TPA: ATP-binding protein [Candidatus Aquilonibacter sp.]|nr:ATP-binding protein [Candidatus Aquilonibacter sp.]
MPACVAPAPPFGDPFETALGTTREQSERFLLQAFRSFADAADSLERSYGMLQAEVARLRGELEHSNAGLERSLESNRRMHRHLDRILKSIPCGVLVLNADGEISLANPAARSLLAFHPGSEIASLARVPGDIRDLLERAKSTSEEQEQSYHDGRGGERWLAARHATLVQSGTGADSASILILRDVSESKRLALERDRMRREQAIAEMSAILAHEIRNPLGSMELFAGLLASAGLPPDAGGWVSQLQAGLRTLSATVNNVLHFHSMPPPARVPTDLGTLIDWAGVFLLPVARQAGVELRVRNHLAGVWFAADRHCLEQVMLNLVLNALRSMPEGGCAEISGRQVYRDEGEGNQAMISVADTGPGIAPADLAKIFEAGFSTRDGSPGLGLAVCRKVAHQHGGTLTAANRAGGGAKFTLRFPLGQETPSGEMLHPPKYGNSTSGQKRARP